MSSQSSYVYHEHPAGLGLIAFRETDPMFNDDRMNPKPVDQYPSGGSSAPKTVDPFGIKTPSVKQPIIQTESIVKPTQVVLPTIDGDHRIGKKKAALIGGGLIGAALLLKLVL